MRERKERGRERERAGGKERVWKVERVEYGEMGSCGASVF